jgi:hypothetical protein
VGRNLCRHHNLMVVGHVVSCVFVLRHVYANCTYKYEVRKYHNLYVKRELACKPPLRHIREYVVKY